MSSFFRPSYLTCLLTMFFSTAEGQVINYDTEITIDEGGKKTTKRWLLVQVNSKTENWLSHVEVSHNPKQKFELEYAHLIDARGNIVRKLKNKELLTTNELSYQAFYQDDLVTEFDLYWSEYPYRVEYAYTIEEDEFLYVAWWSPFYFTYTPVMHASLKIHLPSGYLVRISYSGDMVFKESEAAGRKTLSWRTSMLSNLRNSDIYAPPIEKLIPVVKVVPDEFSYGVRGKTDSWSTFGNWLNQLNEGTDELTLQEKWAVEKLTQGMEDRNEIIKAIYYYLQDRTKYVNVAIDVGGLKSYPATYVCQKKYGDCKALTTYMKAMLKSVGIASYYTIVKAGEDKTEIDTNLPSQQFNHVILAVPSETDTVWLENTSNALPFNYLGTFTQNRYVLVINGDKSRLVKTPALSLDDVLLERRYQFKAINQNTTEVDLALTLRGNEFEDLRYFLKEKDEANQKKLINRHTGLQNLEVHSQDVTDYHRDSTFVRVAVKGSSATLMRQVGNFRVINPLGIALPPFEKPADRKLDVNINYPINKRDISHYNLQVFKQNQIQMPEGITLKSDYGHYSAAYTIDGTALTVVETFTLFADTIPIEKYEDFYGFIDAVTTYKKKSAIVIK